MFSPRMFSAHGVLDSLFESHPVPDVGYSPWSLIALSIHRAACWSGPYEIDFYVFDARRASAFHVAGMLHGLQFGENIIGQLTMNGDF